MLYIDQPVQVGFSYDTLTNITVNTWGAKGYIDANITVTDFSDGVPEQNNTFFVGTSGSQKISHTANSTHHAAVALWHFAQTWFEEVSAFVNDEIAVSSYVNVVMFGVFDGP